MLKLELDPSCVMLGINNRDLQTFKVDLQNNQRIMDSPAGQEVSKCPQLPCDNMYRTASLRIGRCVFDYAVRKFIAEHIHSGTFCWEGFTASLRLCLKCLLCTPSGDRQLHIAIMPPHRKIL